jgi:hypothetical protein
MNTRRFGHVLGLAAALALASPRVAKACAGCRNPSLATSRGSEGPLADGAVRVGATLTGTTVHVIHRAGCADVNECSEVPVEPLHLHDQRLYPLELRLAGEYGLSRTFGAELQVPLRFMRTTVEYTTLGGAPYEPIDAGVHHRDETIVGPADPWLLVRIGSFVGKWWLATRPGVSLPLGRTEEDPFELGDRGLRHQHVQLGTGTVDPIGVVEASRSFEGIELDFFAQAQLSLYENGHGYRAPLRVSGGGTIGTKLVGKLEGGLGVEGFHEGPERWDGIVRQDASLGRSEILAALVATQTLGKTTLSLGLRFPLVRHVVTGEDPQGELSSPVTLSLGVAHIFGGQRGPPDL